MRSYRAIGIDSAPRTARSGRRRRRAARPWPSSRTATGVADVPFDHLLRPRGARAWRARRGRRRAPAINRYLQAEQKGRLVQSVKSFLAAELTETQIYNHTYTIQDLIASSSASSSPKPPSGSAPLEGPVVLGRPVRFAGAEGEEDDAFALGTPPTARRRGGLRRIVPSSSSRSPRRSSTSAPRPRRARPDRRLRRRHERLHARSPRARPRATGAAILGNDGIGLAGDAFDSRVVRQV